MADFRTHLRELGVIVGIYILLRGSKYSFENIKPKYFYDLCVKALKSQDIVPLKDDFNKDNFTILELRILINSFELSHTIYKNFKLSVTDKIVWCGAGGHNDNPADFTIGEYKFSLKEESFILENMGLYKYLSLMTGDRHDRGINIFEMFSKDAYQVFFSFVWDKFISEKKYFSYQNSAYISEAKFVDNKVQLKYQKGNIKVVSILPLEKDLLISKFNDLTESTTREKVFSKWIKENMERDPQYQAIKKTVSELAAASLVMYVKDHLDPKYSGLKRFLRIHEDSYYYAKSTIKGVSIYKVPSLKDFSHVYSIDEISYAVPRSQVNIFTKVKNKINNKVLILRNEVRFSHGQFNGTPEAKMYYDKNSSLETIYEKVC